MQIIKEIHKQHQPCCIALGFFDGVHMGHRRLINSMTAHASENGLSSAVFTFSSSPAAALGKSSARTLMTIESKLSCFDSLSVDKCFLMNFTDFRDVSAETFVNDILIDTLCAKAVFCGYNYRFGKFASGSCGLLSELCESKGVEVFVTAPVCADGDTVSSTRIRNLIENGKMREANTLLTAPFSISGTIAHGLQNGRKVGIPTINQYLPENYVKPRFGVYASFAVIDGKRYRSITNIGVRPTVSGHGINCESHILDDFDGDIYGKNVRTELLWFERDERKFPDLAELAKQIHRDIAHINQLKIYEIYNNGVLENGC